MAIKELQYHIHELVSSIDICRKDRKLTPSLILLYSTIDIMAWLDRDENHKDVRRSDFIKWVETYLLPNYRFSCTALDLYAARCAIIHSYSSESSLSRNGEANMIFYTGVQQLMKTYKIISIILAAAILEQFISINYFARSRMGLTNFC